MLTDFIQKYEAKTHDAFKIPDGFQIAFDEQHGFFVFGFGEWQGQHWLDVGATYVDSWQWVYDSVKDTVISNGLAGVIATTNRSPRAFCKLTGATRYEKRADGQFVLIWEVPNVPT